jgi:hypothetical protein
MRDAPLVRASGIALMVSAPFIAAWLLYQPYAALTSDVAAGSQWVTAHSLHLVGAVFLVLGVGGIGLALRARSGPFGESVNALLHVAAALFLFTGILTAIVMPVAARAAPALYATDTGAFVTPPFLLTIIASVLLAVVAFVLLGIVMLRAKFLPRGAAVLLIVGILFAVAPVDGSVPYVVNVGAVLWPVGLFWTGLAMARRSPAPP